MAKQTLAHLAQSLSRPCLHLQPRRDRGELFGVWGGSGFVSPPKPRSSSYSWNHWISVRCSWFRKHGIPVSGVLSVYEEINHREIAIKQWIDEKVGIMLQGDQIFKMLPRFEQKKYKPVAACVGPVGPTGRFTARLDSSKRFPKNPKGEKLLFGVSSDSLPPLEAILRHGGKEADAFFASLGPSRDFHDIFNSEQHLNYLRGPYTRNNPMMRTSTNVYAVMGGWRCSLPSMKSYDEIKGQLLLWTLRDAEPWLEVWLTKGGRLRVVSHRS